MLGDEAVAFEDLLEHFVVEEMDGFGEVAEEAVGGIVSDVFDPARPGGALRDAGFVGWDEGLESLHVRGGGEDEDFAAGAESVFEKGGGLFELTAGEEVEDVGGVGEIKALGFEFGVAGEAAGEELETVLKLSGGEGFEFVEVFWGGIVGDETGAGGECGDGGDAVGGTDVERGLWGEGALLDEEFAELVEGV